MNSISRRARATVAVILALGSVGTATASARPYDAPPVRFAAATAIETVTAPARAAPPVVRVVRVEDHSGFEWGDAGIGAGVVLAIGLVGAGSVLARSTDSWGRGSPTARQATKHIQP